MINIKILHWLKTTSFITPELGLSVSSRNVGTLKSFINLNRF